MPSFRVHDCIAAEACCRSKPAPVTAIVHATAAPCQPILQPRISSRRRRGFPVLSPVQIRCSIEPKQLEKMCYIVVLYVIGTNRSAGYSLLLQGISTIVLFYGQSSVSVQPLRKRAYVHRPLSRDAEAAF